MVPRAAARACEKSRARPRARRDRLVQRGLPAPAGRGPSVGRARLQHSALGVADVRIFPAQGHGCAIRGRSTGSRRRRMKILTFSTLYPHSARPSHGIFVETRLRHLLASGKVESKVVAPVPWFPSRNARFGEYAIHARAPREETRNGIDVLHPRYPLPPKVGMTLAPFLLAGAVSPIIDRILRTYAFDLIDAHYFYPDGVAAALLGKRLGKPVVITARGTDVNLIPRYRLPRAMIRWAARRAAGMITVARALKDDLIRIGVPGERIEVLRNGVDLQLFRPVEREATRRKLGMSHTTLLSVGLLIPRKGRSRDRGAAPAARYGAHRRRR